MPHDYESLGFRSMQRPLPWLIESYRGTDIVAWQGKIERQLQAFVAEAVEARNHVYADKLRAFLATWRANILSGSLNVETIDALLAATQVSAVDDWKYNSYYSSLRDQLRKLKASVEELPMGDTVAPEDRAPRSSPPTSFGPVSEPPAGSAPGAGENEEGTDEDAEALSGEGGENETAEEEIPGT